MKHESTLKEMRCPHCKKHCQLSNPHCSKGEKEAKDILKEKKKKANMHKKGNMQKKEANTQYEEVDKPDTEKPNAKKILSSDEELFLLYRKCYQWMKNADKDVSKKTEKKKDTVDSNRTAKKKNQDTDDSNRTSKKKDKNSMILFPALGEDEKEQLRYLLTKLYDGRQK